MSSQKPKQTQAAAVSRSARSARANARATAQAATAQAATAQAATAQAATTQAATTTEVVKLSRDNLACVDLPAGWSIARKSILVRQFGSAAWPADGRVAAFDFDDTLVVNKNM
jgi:septal ring factor EnvC (AmiA/AmiB activator)